MLNINTLYDLDIISKHNSDKKTLWEHLNYCRTDGGKNELREILLLKNHSYELTLKRQKAIRYIAERKNIVTPQITETEIYYVQHYLASNYTFDETKYKAVLAVKSYIRLFTSKSSYLYILSGIKQTLTLIESIKETCDALYGKNIPEYLQNILTEINIILGGLQVKRTGFIHNEEPDPYKVFSTDKLLRGKKKKEIAKLLEHYYKIEALLSLTKAHLQLKLSFPQFGDELMMQGLYHPLVDKCIRNNFQTDGQHICLITGPNMAGKSTFLKSVGICFVLGYSGIGVPATTAILPFYEQIFTAINTHDDINSGYSYFYSEVLQVKHIASSIKAKPSMLVIADELFKGTNIKDASDCTCMVIDGFIRSPQSFFILSTHLAETIQEYHTEATCKTVCFEGNNTDSGISFDYSIKEGISDTRLGLYIMKQEKIPQMFGLV